MPLLMLLRLTTLFPPLTVEECCFLSVAIGLLAAACVAVEEGSFPAPFAKNVEFSFPAGAIHASANAPEADDSFSPALTIEECCFLPVAIGLSAAAPAAIKEGSFPAPFCKNVVVSFPAGAICASADSPEADDSFPCFNHRGVLFPSCSHWIIDGSSCGHRGSFVSCSFW